MTDNEDEWDVRRDPAAPEKVDVTTPDGKYTFVIPGSGDYGVSILRYGQPWLDHPQGENAIQRLVAASGNRVPTLLCLVYTLTTQLSPPADPVAFAVEIFGSEEKALRNLGAYFCHVKDRLPQNGVETAIRLLEGRRGISPEDPRSFIRQREEALIRAGLAQ